MRIEIKKLKKEFLTLKSNVKDGINNFKIFLFSFEKIKK